MATEMFYIDVWKYDSVPELVEIIGTGVDRYVDSGQTLCVKHADGLLRLVHRSELFSTERAANQALQSNVLTSLEYNKEQRKKLEAQAGEIPPALSAASPCNVRKPLSRAT